MRNQKFQAFTLVELLAAMAIIGVLLGLSLYGISLVNLGARETQRRNAVAQEINAGIIAYYGRVNAYPNAVKFTKTATGGVVLLASSPTYVSGTQCPAGLVAPNYCMEVPLKGPAVPTNESTWSGGAKIFTNILGTNGNSTSSDTNYCYQGGVAGGYLLAAKLESGDWVNSGTVPGGLCQN